MAVDDKCWKTVIFLPNGYILAQKVHGVQIDNNSYAELYIYIYIYVYTPITRYE